MQRVLHCALRDFANRNEVLEADKALGTETPGKRPSRDSLPTYIQVLFGFATRLRFVVIMVHLWSWGMELIGPLK